MGALTFHSEEIDCVDSFLRGEAMGSLGVPKTALCHRVAPPAQGKVGIISETVEREEPGRKWCLTKEVPGGQGTVTVTWRRWP